jgi:hypothetical protein
MYARENMVLNFRCFFSKGKRGAAVVARRQLEGKGKKKHASVHEETLERIQKNRSKRADRLKHINNPGGGHHHTLPDSTDDSQVALQVMMQEEGGADIQTCFICNEQLYGDLEAVNLHIDNCLSNPNASNTQEEEQEEEEADMDYSDNDDQPNTASPTAAASQSSGWEEYEWAGQRRVRATAMMEGGYGGAGFATTSKAEVDEENEEDLDVEDDDAAQFGQSQYTERDIVVNIDDDTEDASALREMVSGGASTRTSTSDG